MGNESSLAGGGSSKSVQQLPRATFWSLWLYLKRLVEPILRQSHLARSEFAGLGG